MSTRSNDFGFLSTFDEILKESCQKAGLSIQSITVPITKSAFVSANLILTSWMSQGPHSWMRQRRLLELVPNQSSYSLMKNCSQMERAVVTDVSLINDISFNSTQYAFENQSVVNPNWVAFNEGECSIKFSFKENQPVNYLSFQIDEDKELSLDVYSGDVFRERLPVSLFNEKKWFVLNISKVVGDVELRFTAENPITVSNFGLGVIPKDISDRSIGEIAYFDWMSFSNKSMLGFPTSYYLDFQKYPSITLWPTPEEKKFLLYTGYFFPDDINSLLSSFDVPKSFLSAFVSALAYRLCQKFNSSDTGRLQLLLAESENDTQNSAKSEASTYNFSIEPNFSNFEVRR